MSYLRHGFLRKYICHSHNVPPQPLPYVLQVDWHYILKICFSKTNVTVIVLMIMKICDQRDLRENEQFGNNKKIVIIIIYIDSIVFAVTVFIINFVMTFPNCWVLKATLMWKKWFVFIKCSRTYNMKLHLHYEGDDSRKMVTN